MSKDFRCCRGYILVQEKVLKRGTTLISYHLIAVEEFKQFYGIADNRFAEFLATLGLRTYTGEDKEGFKALREEARARGW